MAQSQAIPATVDEDGDDNEEEEAAAAAGETKYDVEEGEPGTAFNATTSSLRRTTAFRLHANNSKHPSDYDDVYRTLTLHADGTFTDYNEHLWDLKSQWVTEGVNRIVYAGTYTLNMPQVQLCYTKVVSKVNNVVSATECLNVDEPLEEPVMVSGTLSDMILTVKPYQGGESVEPHVLAIVDRPFIEGGKYS